MAGLFTALQLGNPDIPNPPLSQSMPGLFGPGLFKGLNGLAALVSDGDLTASILDFTEVVAINERIR